MPDEPDDITEEELEEIYARAEVLTEEEILAEIDRLNREAEEIEKARSEGKSSADETTRKDE